MLLETKMTEDIYNHWFLFSTESVMINQKKEKQVSMTKSRMALSRVLYTLLPFGDSKRLPRQTRSDCIYKAISRDKNREMGSRKFQSRITKRNLQKGMLS